MLVQVAVAGDPKLRPQVAPVRIAAGSEASPDDLQHRPRLGAIQRVEQGGQPSGVAPVDVPEPTVRRSLRPDRDARRRREEMARGGGERRRRE